MIAVMEGGVMKRAGVRSEPGLHDMSAYRRLALSMPGATEGSHMGAVDFRIEDRIFATLAYGYKGLGTLKLSVEQQAMFLSEAPEYFSAAPGGWGRMGMTLVRVDAPEDVLSGALSTAFRHVMAKQAVKKSVAKKRAATRKKA
jgi:hypothetical protein